MASWHPTDEHLPCIKALLSDPVHWTGVLDSTTPVPDEMSGWLARLRLLYGIPFNYLVPDVRMLPAESIRFFYLDPNWLDAITDGAMSIGRTTTKDAAHDNAVKGIVHESAAIAAGKIRPSFGKDVAATDGNTLLSGFLLRSAVVSGWPGLEVQAYSDTNQQNSLGMLRFERLSQDVLIGIFDGVYQQLFLHEPSEGIQFGANATPSAGSATQFLKDQLRGLGCSGQANAGQSGSLTDSIAVPIRAGTDRVIEAATFATGTTQASGGLPYYLAQSNIDCPDPLTYSQLAVEMVQSPERQQFTNEAESTPTVQVASRPQSAALVGPSKKKLHQHLFGKA